MKHTSFYIKLIATALLITLNICSVYAQSVRLLLSGIRNNEGIIRLTIYNNEESYKKEIPDIIKEVAKDSLNNGSITLLLDNMTPGVWGIAVIDDENKNGRLDRKFFIPKEGFGFSNYPFTKYCKPEFIEFSFNLVEGVNDVTVNIFYF